MNAAASIDINWTVSGKLGTWIAGLNEFAGVVEEDPTFIDLDLLP